MLWLRKKIQVLQNKSYPEKLKLLRWAVGIAAIGLMLLWLATWSYRKPATEEDNSWKEFGKIFDNLKQLKSDAETISP